MKIEQSKFLLSAQRALLFCVTSTMRLIFIEICDEGRLKMLVYVQTELSKDELDMLYSAAGEICGDFIGVDYSDVEVVVSNSSYEQIKGLKHLVYARAE